MRWKVLAVGLEVVAAACTVVAYTKRHETLSGVYFGSSEDTSLNPSGSWFDPFNPSEPYLWAGAGFACAVTGAIVAALALFRRT